MSLIEINGLFNVVGFAVGLVAVIVLFGIVKRTKDEVRYGFLFVLAGMVAFVVLEFFNIVKVFDIVIHLNQTISVVADLFGLVFVLLLVVGVWKLRRLIRGLSDFGQAFVLIPENDYKDKLASIIRGVKGVCYVTLKEPFSNVVDFLDLYGIDTSSMQFIDATGVKCDAENCIEIKNNPDEIKSTLDRVLKEKDISCVVIDDVAAVKKIKRFELPEFIQDTSSLIKANESQGFFVGKMEDLSKQTINDIAMLVDKVIKD